MGQGGFFDLVNNTPYDWRRTYQHSYQMNAWSFPEVVPAYGAVRVYVEFDEGAGKTTGDDAGEATFEFFPGTDGQKQFKFYVRFRRLGVELLEFPVTIYPNTVVPKGTQYDIGWNHNQSVTFTLQGQDGNYIMTTLV
ncbi:hypothetical protein C8Q80DRAFT_1203390 [Daedaleopsis nitida]|nr:hypothetical protein C8Q80DRAFT_1203390 [Daedaleopsis nitida]